MVMIYLRDPRRTTGELVQKLSGQGVAMNAVDHERLRAVTHLDVNRAEIEETVTIFKTVLEAE